MAEGFGPLFGNLVCGREHVSCSSVIVLSRWCWRMRQAPCGWNSGMVWQKATSAFWPRPMQRMGSPWSL